MKLFDKVAVEAVENYQATVAFEEIQTTNNTDGGIKDGTEQKVDDHRVTDSNDKIERSEAQETNGERSRVQSFVGKEGEINREDGSVQRQHRGLRTETEPFIDEDYVSARHKTFYLIIIKYKKQTRRPL